MKNYSEAVKTALAKKQGLEVVLFVGVEWVDGSEMMYSSTTVTGAHKSIVSISNLESVSQVGSSGISQSVDITLSDTDGALTEIMDRVDIHKRPAKVYLGFSGVPLEQSVVLLDGVINSPIQWDVRSRALSFSIVTKVEDRLFGFAAEDGMFDQVDSASRTSPWPFRFGETCAYPATEVLGGGVRGVLKSGQGVMDPTLDTKICQSLTIDCPNVDNQLYSVGEPTPAENLANARDYWKQFQAPRVSPGLTDTFGQPLTYPQGITGPKNPTTGKVLEGDQECLRNKFLTLCQLYHDRANQLEFINESLVIVGGSKFPQGEVVSIRVGDVIYDGVFAGDAFKIHATNRLDAPLSIPDCVNVPPPSAEFQALEIDIPTSAEDCHKASSKVQLRVVGGAGAAWRALGGIPDSGFKWLPAGTTVYLDSSKEVHVVSCVPGVVTGVYCHRRIGDSLQLTEVPTDYYEVVNTNYGGLRTVEIHLNRSLESYVGENWSGSIYTQFISDVGPNPVDVIEWIAERYTSFTPDAASFAAVRAKLNKYPCNYTHNKRENVIVVLKRIAYEARCVLTIEDNKMKLTYLPEEPDAVLNITSNNVVSGSFGYSLTTSEDLVTASYVSWKPNGALNSGLSFSVENNVEKYGLHSLDHVYETISNEEQALKTATFWSIRDSNTWKIVSFSTTLENMGLELYDCVSLQLDYFPHVKAVVTNVAVNVDSGVVEVECWTPVLSGEMAEYLWAWPAEQNAGRMYPTNNFDVEVPKIAATPPPGHPLYVENQTPPVRNTIGDRRPSDLDDVTPDFDCTDVLDADAAAFLIDQLDPTFAKFKADTFTQAVRADNITARGTADGHVQKNTGQNFNFKKSKSQWDDIEGHETGAPCQFVVTAGYYMAPKVMFGQPCVPKVVPCDTAKYGYSCVPYVSKSVRHTFGSRSSAEAFVAAAAGIKGKGLCDDGYTPGQWKLIFTHPPRLVKGSEGCGEEEFATYGTHTNSTGSGQ